MMIVAVRSSSCSERLLVVTITTILLATMQRRSKIEQLMINRLIIRIDSSYNSSLCAPAVFLCGAEDVWCVKHSS